MNYGEYLRKCERCPRCGVSVPNLVEIEKFIKGPNHRVYRVLQCNRCHDCVLVQVETDAKKQLPHTWTIDNIYPEVSGVPSEFPERAKKYFEQALNSLVAPDGCVMLCGSAVDAMLKDKKLLDGSVYNRIDEAVKIGLLTAEMAEWAHAVRLGANRPRHADNEDPHVTPAEAENAIEYVKTLGHILYVLPKMVADGKASANKADEAQQPDN